MRLGTLIALLPLLIALIVVVMTGRKTLKVSPLGPDEKEVMQEVGKSVLYIFAAAALLWWVMPSLGVMGTIFGTILTVTLAVAVIITVIVLPTRLNAVHNLAWRDWRKTPLYSRTGRPVEYVRWARRFAMLLFFLFAFVVTLAGGLSPDREQRVDAASAPPAVVDTPKASPAVPDPAKESSAPSTPTAPAPELTDETVNNTCGGPSPTKVDQPTTIKFGKDNLKICRDDKWQDWDAVNPGKAAPKEVTLRAWTADATYGYGEVVTADGTSYLIQTTDF